MLSQLNTYASLIGALSTVAIAFLTVLLWAENRRLRKAGNTPDVVVYLTPHPDGHGGMQFVLANVGKGPAYNLTFEFQCDEADFAAHDVVLVNDKDRMPIAVLPQDEKIASLFGIGFELYGKVDKKDIGPLKPFKVLVRYSDGAGRKQVRERAIDIRQFAGLRGIFERSHRRDMARSLQGIEKHLASLSRQSARYPAFVDKTGINDEYVQKAKGSDPETTE